MDETSIGQGLQVQHTKPRGYRNIGPEVGNVVLSKATSQSLFD